MIRYRVRDGRDTRRPDRHRTDRDQAVAPGVEAARLDVDHDEPLRGKRGARIGGSERAPRRDPVRKRIAALRETYDVKITPQLILPILLDDLVDALRAVHPGPRPFPGKPGGQSAEEVAEAIVAHLLGRAA